MIVGSQKSGEGAASTGETLRLALVGDYTAAAAAHRAIPAALERAGRDTGFAVEPVWVSTDSIQGPEWDLAGFDGMWLVPASPYRNMAGALAAVRGARTRGIPFFGSCGGFQHGLIEIARNVAGIGGADHAESAPAASDLVITPLACSLVEKTGVIRFQAGSRLQEIYGSDSTTEGYHCSYGLNADYAAALEQAGVRFTGHDELGQVRAFELTGHPFFLGTLFQPERGALRGERVPIAEALVRAAGAGSHL